MWSRTSGVEGEVIQQLLDLYENAAKGGPEMIVVEAVGLDGRYVWPEPQLRIDDARFMPGLGRVVDLIHRNGCACEHHPEKGNRPHVRPSRPPRTSGSEQDL